MNNFRTYKLAVTFYKRCVDLKMPAHLKNQLLRASSSVALNLAEGRGRSSLADQKRFFSIAMGSIRECQSIFDLQCPSKEVIAILDQLAAACYLLIRHAR